MYGESTGRLNYRLSGFTCASGFDGVVTFTGDADVRAGGTTHQCLPFTEADNITLDCGA